MVMAPLQEPLQLGLMVEVTNMFTPGLLLTFTLPFLVQPLLSVTVTL